MTETADEDGSVPPLRTAVQRRLATAPSDGRDVAVAVVGSAYSGRQGWVVGALCTAEKTLREAFDVPRPAWLDEDYYLGWEGRL